MLLSPWTGSLLGALLWIAFVVLLGIRPDPLTLVVPLLLFALLVLMPLLIGVVPAISDEREGRMRIIAGRIYPFAAISAALSFRLEPGTTAGMFSLLWLVFSLLLAAHALERLRYRGFKGPIHELAFDVGLLYLPIGAVWLVAERLGWVLFGFEGTILLIIALHIHYAGLLMPFLAGLALKHLADSSAARGIRVALPVIVAGPILATLGIVLSPALGVIAAAFLAVGVALLAASVLMAVVSPRLPLLPRLLLGIWGSASTVAVVLTLLYALSSFLESYLVNIPRIIRFHGILNAVAPLCGLACWGIVERQESRSGTATATETGINRVAP